MFHDNENKSLYTITLGDLEEAEFKLALKRKAAKSEKELEYIDATEEMRDVQLSSNQMINFPVTTGITSLAFKSQKIKYFNDFLPHTNMSFVSDVDNIKSLSKIENLMFVPMTREDGTSNGVI